jgi:hypothetical protein
MAKPETLLSLILASGQEPPPIQKQESLASLKHLYVVEADFQISDKYASSFSDMIAETRAKYGIDFILLEKGMRIKPFNE